MFIFIDPDDCVATSEHHTCAFHKANPDIRDWPGCTCSASYGTRPATADEYAANRARRLDQERRKADWLRGISPHFL